jgi:hypothetical protein
MVGKLIGSVALVAALSGIAVDGVLASTMPVRDPSYRPFRSATHTGVAGVVSSLHDDLWATRTGRVRAGSAERATNPYVLVWRLPDHGRVSPEAS